MARKSTFIWGLLSIILGIIAFFWDPYVIIALLAILFGIIGYKNESAKALGIIGIILGIINLVLFIIHVF
jgi:uncharacterized membrane protein